MVKASGPPSVGGSGDALGDMSTVMPMEPPPAYWSGAVWSAQLSAEYVLVINVPSAVNSGWPASTQPPPGAVQPLNLLTCPQSCLGLLPWLAAPSSLGNSAVPCSPLRSPYSPVWRSSCIKGQQGG